MGGTGPGSQEHGQGESRQTHVFSPPSPHVNARAVSQSPTWSSSLALTSYLVPALKRPLPLLEQVSFLSLGHGVLCSQSAPRLLHHLPQLGGLKSSVDGGQQLVSPRPQSIPQGPKLGPPVTAFLLRPAGCYWALTIEYSQPARECPVLGSP